MSYIKSLSLVVSLILTLALVLPADARPRVKGDWISSGAAADLILNEPPAYPFEYTCQVEMSNGYTRKDGAVLLAVANFTVNNARYDQVRSDDLQWTWMYQKIDGSTALLAKKSKHGFSTDHHRFTVTISEALTSDGPDQVALGANVTLSSGNLIVPEYVSAHDFTREDKELFLWGSNSGYTLDNKAVDISMQMFCEKVR